MADLIKKGALFLMSQKCYDNYVLEHNFLDGKLSRIQLHRQRQQLLINLFLMGSFFIACSAMLQGAVEQRSWHRNYCRFGAG